jgi:dynamin 1/3
LECVDTVLAELDNVLQNCLDTMARYPRLQDEARCIINNHLLKCEQKCRDQIKLIIEFELAYMNINHEDFGM